MRYLLSAALALLLSVSLAQAHSGGLAKDGCHNDRAAGERHWHVPGGTNVGGLCGPSGTGPLPEAQVAESPEEPDEVAVLQDLVADQVLEISTLEDRVAYLTGQMSSLTTRAETAETSNRSLIRKLERASDEVERAQEATALARTVAEEAEQRARGSGPRVDVRCRRAVEGVVYGETGWLSDSVKVDREGRAALSRACLDP